MQLDHAFLDRFALFDASPAKPNGTPPAAKLAMLIRPTIIAPPGKTLVWCDWSAIEARVLPWLAASRGAEKVLDIFRNNDLDPHAPDIYEIEAARLLGKSPEDVTPDERQSHGKVTVLSLGFGGGVGALQNMATNYGVYISEAAAEAMVEGWRENNPWARSFWGRHTRNESSGLWGAACKALTDPDTIYQVGRVAYVYDRSYLGGTLFCALPCGRPLAYPSIKWETREVEERKTKKLVERTQLTFRKGYGRSALWYGKLAENITQAAAASILRGTLTKLDALEFAWMPVVGHTHDEIVTQPGGDRTAVAMMTLHELMVEGFDWSEGLPLAAESGWHYYYTKAKV